MPQIRTWKTPPNKLTIQQRLIQGRMDRDPPRRRRRRKRNRQSTPKAIDLCDKGAFDYCGEGPPECEYLCVRRSTTKVKTEVDK